MAKFYGRIGFAETVETAPGVWTENIVDYNQQKYLIETRCSGALIKPYSAIALETKTTTA